MRKLMFGFVILVLASCATSGEKKDINPCKNDEYAKIMRQKTEADFAKGDYYLALDDILAVKKCSPKDPEVFFWLGRIYQSRMEPGKAEENYLLAIQYNKDYSHAYMALGNLYLTQNKNEWALENYQKAAADDTFREAYIAWNNIGWIFMLQDKYPEAEQSFLRSLGLQPGFCNPYCNLGELKTKQRKYAEAVVQLQKAISICPDFARAHRLLGLEYNRQGKISDACREFALARKNTPADSEDALSAGQYLRVLNCPNEPVK